MIHPLEKRPNTLIEDDGEDAGEAPQRAKIRRE
jgi:hypothetical protein